LSADASISLILSYNFLGKTSLAAVRSALITQLPFKYNMNTYYLR